MPFRSIIFGANFQMARPGPIARWTAACFARAITRKGCLDKESSLSCCGSNWMNKYNDDDGFGR